MYLAHHLSGLRDLKVCSESSLPCLDFGVKSVVEQWCYGGRLLWTLKRRQGLLRMRRK